MFKSLSDKLGNVFDRLKGKGVLSEDDINTAMREVRVALLEADVALPVAREFIAKTKEQIIGQEIVKSVSPAQMVIKLVQDQLTQFLGEENTGLELNTEPPAVIMMVGLQGSGKTTSAAKLARRLKTKNNKKVMLASLDVYRPSAQEQLEILGKQIEVDSLPIKDKQKPLDITKRALKEAKLAGYDVLILDTAGRLHIDDDLMSELIKVRDLAKPAQTLLVADSLTGQDAVNIAQEFHAKIGVTGIVLTRIDGDGRGGAALSMKHVTGQPIKYMGTGEKLENFEEFYPERISSRILDKGDVVSLVEKASEQIDKADAKQLEARLKKGNFDMNDLRAQLEQMDKMGGIGGIMNFMPGMGKIKEKLNDAMASNQFDSKVLDRQKAIISSMTRAERAHPKVINGSRKMRIANGSGVEVQDVNRLLKQFKQMQTMMKKVGKMGKNKKALMGMMNKMGKGNFDF